MAPSIGRLPLHLYECQGRLIHESPPLKHYQAHCCNSSLQSVEERKARIERVNRQLKEFYGPLLACVSATASAKKSMIKQVIRAR